MSAGVACQIHGREWWYVSARRCNYSAFNGYQRTPSEYSEVMCGHPDRSHRKDGTGEGSRWRTTAAYVDDLPDEYNWISPLEQCSSESKDGLRCALKPHDESIAHGAPLPNQPSGTATGVRWARWKP